MSTLTEVFELCYETARVCVNLGDSLSDTQRALNLSNNLRSRGSHSNGPGSLSLLRTSRGKIHQLGSFWPKDSRSGTLYSFRD